MKRWSVFLCLVLVFLLAGVVMASPATYTVEVDTQLDGDYGDALDDVTEYVKSASWRVGMDEPYQEVANPSQCYITLDNSDGRFDVARSGAAFEGLLTPGMLVRVKMTYKGWTQQMWEGRIAVDDPLVGPKLAEPFVRVRAIDPMYDFTRFDYSPELLTDVRTDEALQAIFDNAPLAYPYDGNFAALGLSYLGQTTYLFDPSGFVSFETGQATIGYSGAIVDPGVTETTIKVSQVIREIIDQEGGGRFFWQGRDHTFVFHSRHHDLLIDPGSMVSYAIDVEAAPARYGDDVVNWLTMRWQPKALGSTNSILYEADNVPFTLRNGQTRRIQARFRDPDNPDVRVAAETVVTPLLGTHVVTSDDSSISMAYAKRANLLTLDLTNTGDVDVSVTAVVVRGTPILTYNPEEIEKLDVDSIATYGKRARAVSKKFQNVDDAEGFSQSLINTFSTATVRIPHFELRAEGEDSTYFAQFATVGDMVAIDDSSNSGHTANYIIVGEGHEVDGDGNHVAKYIVKRHDKLGALLLGRVGFAELGENSFLAF
jgi:hypothetical protein